jgi:hypothetical protein
MVVDNEICARAASRAGLTPRKWSRPWQVAAHSAQVDLFPAGLFAEDGILVAVGCFRRLLDRCLAHSGPGTICGPRRGYSDCRRPSLDQVRFRSPGCGASSRCRRRGWQRLFNAGGNFNSLLPGSDDLEPWYKVEERDTVTVPVRTLDGLLGSEDVALLKLDVQGVESAVLRGAEDTLTRTRAVYIETNFASHYQGDSLFPPTPRGSESWFRLHDIGRPYHDWNGCTLWCDLLYARST